MAKKEDVKLSEEVLNKLLKNEVDLTISGEETNEIGNPETNIVENEVESEIDGEIEIDGESEMDGETEEGGEINGEIDYKSRGFETLEDCVNFPKTDTFKRLGNADKEEFIKWLKK